MPVTNAHKFKSTQSAYVHCVCVRGADEQLAEQTTGTMYKNNVSNGWMGGKSSDMLDRQVYREQEQ